jgi:hypothetical protein
MIKDIKKKIIERTSVLIVVGIFIVMALAPTVSADGTDWSYDGDSWGQVRQLGSNDNNDVAFITNTNEVMRIDTNGRLGIGDTSPDFKLEVTGSSGSGYFGVTTSSDGDTFIIDSNGKVGIGTASPGSTLEIKSSSAGMASALHVKNSASTSLLFVRDDGNIGIGLTNPAEKLEINGNILFNFGSARSISVETCPTPDAAGNQLTVGAGNAVGGGVAGFDGGNLYLRSGDGAGTGIGGGDGGDVYIYGGAKAQFTGRDDGDIILAHDGSVALRKVGIGTTSPSEKLEIDGNIKLTGGNKWIGVSSTQGVYIKSDGNVGIGTTGPNDELEVVGDASADRFVARTGAADVEFADEDGTDGVKIENSDNYEHIWIGDYSVTSQNFRGIYLDGALQTTSIGIVDTRNRLVVSSPDNDDTVRLLGPDGGATAYGARLNFGDSEYVYIEEDGNNDLYIYANDRTAIMGGNVGIGDTNPLTKLYVDGDVAFGDHSTLTMDIDDEVTVTHTYHVINARTESADDLQAISGGNVAGQILIITAATGDTITVKDDNVNLKLNGDFSMDSEDTMVLIWDEIYWYEISRSEN